MQVRESIIEPCCICHQNLYNNSPFVYVGDMKAKAHVVCALLHELDDPNVSLEKRYDLKAVLER